jgi:SAM-dependent methyltransferase
MQSVSCFAENKGCPFCHRPSTKVLFTVHYRETAEANADIPDIEGRLFECEQCGIAYPSHQYDIGAFPKLYQKTFDDLDFLDASAAQKLRKRYLKAILKGQHRSWSVSRFLDHLSLHSLQPPHLTKKPLGLKMLDVGAGFGEFLSIYRDLGNNVVGTEILPQLVERLQKRGFDCRPGELESIDFNGDRFDAIVFRAVFYRTRQPEVTLKTAQRLLANGGEIICVDPAPGRDGAEYFLRKQFPQGQFYIVEPDRYLAMVEERFGLRCVSRQLIYGRPAVALKPVRSTLGNVIGLGELMAANLFRYRPYMLSYALRAV